MKCLFCPAPVGWFLCCSGCIQLRGWVHQLPSNPSQLREKEPRVRAAEASGGLSSHRGSTRPGSHPDTGLAPGGETGRRAPPFLAGGEGDRCGKDSQAAANPHPGQVRQRGRGGAGVPARDGRLWGGSLDSGARPAHHGRSGPRPGAFRARAAACLGKSRPPSGRRGPCPAERGRGFPESARRPPSRHWTESAHIWAALPFRQQGKPRRALQGGTVPAHCAYSPRHPAPRCWEAGPRPRPGLSNPRDQAARGGSDTPAAIERCLGRAGEVRQIPTRATNSSGVGASHYSPPPALRVWKKRRQKLIKNLFFYLNRFNKKSEQQTHTRTQTHLKINSLETVFVFLHSTVQRGRAGGEDPLLGVPAGLSTGQRGQLRRDRPLLPSLLNTQIYYIQYESSPFPAEKQKQTWKGRLVNVEVEGLGAERASGRAGRDPVWFSAPPCPGARAHRLPPHPLIGLRPAVQAGVGGGNVRTGKGCSEGVSLDP